MIGCSTALRALILRTAGFEEGFPDPGIPPRPPGGRYRSFRAGRCNIEISIRRELLMSFVPTQEIADSELDNIAGGLHSATVSNATAALDSIAPVSGTVATVTGVVEGATGINTAAITGPVTGLVAGL
ncbi:conserved hypothetical protein [Streptomyces pristinaespiralis ATCC 25486]|uniref:Uncharacterized protein n=3 Tax=Streptomyces TaxID=1883 RepID=B5H8Z3_STRE2|nr:conserved hypothetical protein [Streptomyces pristinaespiralis ATCC 25486]